MDRLVQINMKYLPIEQSHLNAACKYSFDSITSNNLKCEFTKVSEFEYPNLLNPIEIDEDLLIRLFKKYMNNDIWIDWYK